MWERGICKLIYKLINKGQILIHTRRHRSHLYKHWKCSRGLSFGDAWGAGRWCSSATVSRSQRAVLPEQWWKGASDEVSQWESAQRRGKTEKAESGLFCSQKVPLMTLSLGTSHSPSSPLACRQLKCAISLDPSMSWVKSSPRPSCPRGGPNKNKCLSLLLSPTAHHAIMACTHWLETSIVTALLKRVARVPFCDVKSSPGPTHKQEAILHTILPWLSYI